MKKLVIVGGGVAGLSAAIYGCKAGYQVEVYEKHSIVGGECTGWKRKGLMIDNCIHWLTGTLENRGLHQVWKEVGILKDNIEILQMDAFYAVEIDNQIVTLWRDAKRTEKEFLQIAPEDEKEIKKFFKYLRLAEKMDMPVDVPYDLLGVKDILKLSKMGMASMRVMKEYGQTSIKELCQRFHNPILKKVLQSYMPPEYLSYALLFSYATITSGNGGIPKGGSYPMAMRMKEMLEKLGGKVFTSKEVEQVILSKEDKNLQQYAKGIALKDGSKVMADYVILTCDTNYIFHNLLDVKYMHPRLKDAYQKLEKYPIRSGFQVAFSIPAGFNKVDGSLIFETNPVIIANKEYHSMGLRNYNYDESFTNEGRTVLQTNFNQYFDDYDFWFDLYNSNKAKYKEAKENISLAIKENIINKFPELKDDIDILDVWTPVTYNRYVNAFKGSYMSFFETKGMKSIRINESINGVLNVFVASQWLMTPGGLPCAVVEGKFAVQRIMKQEKKNIRQI